MKKVVLGKEVNINNMATVEKAFEGMAKASKNVINNQFKSKMSLDGLEGIAGIMKQYYAIYNKMPFPLNCIEEKIKYSCIGMAMQSISDETFKFKVMDNGIVVGINQKTGVYFSSGNWKLVLTEGINWDSYVDISLYSKHPSYREFEWVISKIIEGESLKDYYKIFMGELYDACNGNKAELRKQLACLLNIKPIAGRVINIRENSILDADNNKEYTMDVYTMGIAKNGQKNIEITFDKNNNFTTGEVDEVEKYYGFEVYSKDIVIDKGNMVKFEGDVNKMSKVKIPGMMGVFEMLMQDGIEQTYNKVYRGIIYGDSIVFVLNGCLYRTAKGKYTEPKLIDRQVDIVGVHKNLVYYYRKSKAASGVIRSELYEYNCNTDSTEVCAIEFE